MLQLEKLLYQVTNIIKFGFLNVHIPVLLTLYIPPKLQERT